MPLTLSKTPVGTLRPPQKWSNEEQRAVPLDAKEEFISRLVTKGSNLIYRCDNIPAQGFHKNYMKYLQKCWGDHLGIIVTPDIVWYSLLCEITQLVSSDPEKYRELFSETKEKQTIVIITGELVVMPIDRLVSTLKDLVPTDADKFLPQFSTSTLRSQHALSAAFADLCSPYYNYCMMLCGFPSVDVRGTLEDWKLVAANWVELSKLFAGKWFGEVQSVLNDIVDNLNNPEFWRNMFSLEMCGSGSDVEVSGWWTKLYMKQPKVVYPDNFSTHVSKVNYRQLDTKKDYQMQVGLFSSNQEDDFLVPDFGYVVYEDKNAKNE